MLRHFDNRGRVDRAELKLITANLKGPVSERILFHLGLTASTPSRTSALSFQPDSEICAEIWRMCPVRILYSCESGSRGWGFASPTSITTCDSLPAIGCLGIGRSARKCSASATEKGLGAIRLVHDSHAST